MKIKIKEKRKLSTNNKKYLERKQDTFLRSETFLHYRNKRIRSYYRNDTFTKKETHNI